MFDRRVSLGVILGKKIMSDQRGRKRTSYKRWLYDSDQSKPKVTKWREQKKTASLNDAQRDESGWIDNSIEFEEINSDDDHNPAFEIDESSGSGTSQFSDVCETNTILSSSEDCYFQSEESHASHSSMEISTVLEAGLPIGKFNLTYNISLYMW